MRRDGCRPITYDPNKIIVGCCEKQAGGVKKPGAPVFTPRIVNTVDSCEVNQFWADETGELIITDDEQFILLDNTCEADGIDIGGVFLGCGECARNFTEADLFWIEETGEFILTDFNENVAIDNRF